MDSLIDDETRLEVEKQMDLAQGKVRDVAKYMTHGLDRNDLADILGVSRRTLDDKLREGRFKTFEFFLLADICGYNIRIVKRETK